MSAVKTIALITGANSGIGFDTAAALAAASSEYLVIMSSRSLDKGQKALADLQARKLSGTLSLVQLDVTDTTSIAAAVDWVSKEYGRLDVLINNAGTASAATSTSLQTQLREHFETNTFGPALVTEAFLTLLKKSAAPRLIYVTSSLGSIEMRINPPFPAMNIDFTPYRMCKAALNMLAGCHHALYKEWGCKVWTYCPGYVATNFGGVDKETKRKNNPEIGNSEDSAAGILDIVKGKRDADDGGFVHRDGVYPW